MMNTPEVKTWEAKIPDGSTVMSGMDGSESGMAATAEGASSPTGAGVVRSSQRESSAFLRRVTTGGTVIDKEEALAARRRSLFALTEAADEGLGEDDGGGSAAGSEDDVVLWFKNPETGENCGLTEDHCKLLYMMSKYARSAQSASEPESWIRQMSLLVLIYEGIVAGVLDYDYAPCSYVVSAQGSSQRLWVNITQEGKAGVDDLREWKLINGLKLSTEDFQPVTAFQVSGMGMKLLKRVPKKLCKEVNTFIYHGNSTAKRDLLQVSFRKGEVGGDGEFFLSTESGYSMKSSVTDSEDVSYVSSPFLPSCLRATDRKPTDNSSRAGEAARGISSIRDELSVAVELANVRALVGEWIPFGSNQIVALNERLGAMDRCQGGLFTAMIDDSPNDTNFDVDCGLTSVKILDFDLVRFINFEAEIMYPEEEGVVQIENFGMHLNVDGTVIYGLKIESILDALADCTCVDHLARLLVDVHQDSSRIMNDLLSPYQRSLLNMIFTGDMMARNKFNMLLADSITPLLPASSYIDRSERETELKQVLGDIHACYDLSDTDRLLLGRDGALLVGPEGPKREQLVILYLSLLSKELMVRNFFNRTFVLDDELVKVRRLTQTYRESPFNVEEMRKRLQDSTQNLVLLQETLGYINESLQMQKIPRSTSGDEVGRQLKKRLAVRSMHYDVSLRVKDLFKLMDGAANKVKILQLQNTAIDKITLEDTVKSIDANYTALVAASAAEQRSSASLEVMNIIFSGSFAFDIVDRLSGDDILGAVGVDSSRGLGWLVIGVKDALVAPPLVFFLLNILWLVIVGLSLQKLMRYLVAQALGALSLRRVFDRKLDVAKFERFLTTVKLDSSGATADKDASIAKAVWYDDDERWGKGCMKIDVLYNATEGFLLSALFNWNKKEITLSNDEVVQTFVDLLEAAGAFTPAPVADNEEDK